MDGAIIWQKQWRRGVTWATRVSSTARRFWPRLQKVGRRRLLFTDVKYVSFSGNVSATKMVKAGRPVDALKKKEKKRERERDWWGNERGESG